MSEFEQDYIMRQIKNLAGALAKLLFHKQSPSYTVTSEEHRTDADKLYLELGALLDEGRVNDAENLLFERMDPACPEILEVAIDFYDRIDGWEDETLESFSYSRAEIREGLLSALRFYHVPMEQIVAYFPQEN